MCIHVGSGYLIGGTKTQKEILIVRRKKELEKYRKDMGYSCQNLINEKIASSKKL